MKKENLKTGMVVKLKEGTKYMVLRNTPCRDCLVRHPEHYIPLDNYTDDLRNIHTSDCDIEEIYCPTLMYMIREADWEDMEPIFKKTTIAEIERELGYDIEIVGGEE